MNCPWINKDYLSNYLWLLIRVIQCMGYLPNKYSWTFNVVIFSYPGESSPRSRDWVNCQAWDTSAVLVSKECRTGSVEFHTSVGVWKCNYVQRWAKIEIQGDVWDKVCRIKNFVSSTREVTTDLVPRLGRAVTTTSLFALQRLLSNCSSNYVLFVVTAIICNRKTDKNGVPKSLI